VRASHNVVKTQPVDIVVIEKCAMAIALAGFIKVSVMVRSCWPGKGRERVPFFNLRTRPAWLERFGWRAKPHWSRCPA